MKKLLALLVCFLFGMALINSCKKDTVIPTLTTSAVTNITINSGTSGGAITKDGGAAVTARGVCWGTAVNPVISGSHTTDSQGTGSFTSNIADLTPNTLYHVRAYATNSAGTAYGNDVSFTTTPIVVATLTTAAVTSITLTTAVSGGNITADGGGAITARGVCWATTAAPTIGATNTTTDGTGTGSFTSNLSGLLPATTYYVRAYATNSAGTAYGTEVSFLTTAVVVPTLTTAAITGVTLTSAVSGGTITADGGGAVTARGVCWATTANPVIGAINTTTNGTGTGSFTSNLSALLPATQYHVRAYATNSAGTAYGNDISFLTTAVVVPTLTTVAVTGVTLTTAVSGGNITADGGGAVTARGVCWATTANPVIGATNTTTNGTGTGIFASTLSVLLPGTPYHVRAYATNSAGTAYGNDISFTTSIAVATLTTTTITTITLTSAVSGGNITADGGGTVTARGVCWATTADPVIGALNTTTNGTGTGIFASALSSLLPGTTYHVRAYATNGAGTAYGNDISFITTAIVVPTLTTVAATGVTLTTAVSGGNITADGGGAVTARGVCWAITTNPIIGALNTTTDGIGIGSFISNLSPLLSGTTYYVRAYATNSAGTAYGNQLSFTTVHETSTLTDNDGNTYNTVKIGDQWWMAENLKTTKLSDGPNTPIANVTDNTAWISLSTPAYSWFNNDIANKPLYGAMYNWFTVNTGNLCPTGWHVPTDGEFNTLELYLGMASDQTTVWGWRGTDLGTQLKNTTGWAVGPPDQNGTNTSGFSALPGGYRYSVNGFFNDLGNLTYFWTATAEDALTSWYRRLDGNNVGSYRAGTTKTAGKSIRCVKD